MIAWIITIRRTNGVYRSYIVFAPDKEVALDEISTEIDPPFEVMGVKQAQAGAIYELS